MATKSWALVTGASSGLGRDFVEALAAQGHNIVLTARRAEPMEALAESVRSRFSVQTHVEALDLSEEGAAASLKSRLDARCVAINVLINNAGHGVTADFLESPVERIGAMLRLNMVGVTELTHLYAADMAKRGGGQIMLVASVAAFQPVPHMAAYAATKAFVVALGEALHVELKPRHVVVTVLSPGVTDTNFFDAAGESASPMMKRMMMKPREVVDVGLAAMAAGRSGVIAGGMNRVMSFFTRFISRHRLARIAYRMATP